MAKSASAFHEKSRSVGALDLLAIEDNLIARFAKFQETLADCNHRIEERNFVADQLNYNKKFVQNVKPKYSQKYRTRYRINDRRLPFSSRQLSNSMIDVNVSSAPLSDRSDRRDMIENSSTHNKLYEQFQSINLNRNRYQHIIRDARRFADLRLQTFSFVIREKFPQVDWNEKLLYYLLKVVKESQQECEISNEELFQSKSLQNINIALPEPINISTIKSPNIYRTHIPSSKDRIILPEIRNRKTDDFLQIKSEKRSSIYEKPLKHSNHINWLINFINNSKMKSYWKEELFFIIRKTRKDLNPVRQYFQQLKLIKNEYLQEANLDHSISLFHISADIMYNILTDVPTGNLATICSIIDDKRRERLNYVSKYNQLLSNGKLPNSHRCSRLVNLIFSCDNDLTVLSKQMEAYLIDQSETKGTDLSQLFNDITNKRNQRCNRMKFQLITQSSISLEFASKCIIEYDEKLLHSATLQGLALLVFSKGSFLSSYTYLLLVVYRYRYSNIELLRTIFEAFNYLHMNQYEKEYNLYGRLFDVLYCWVDGLFYEDWQNDDMMNCLIKFVEEYNADFNEVTQYRKQLINLFLMIILKMKVESSPLTIKHLFKNNATSFIGQSVDRIEKHSYFLLDENGKMNVDELAFHINSLFMKLFLKIRLTEILNTRESIEIKQEPRTGFFIYSTYTDKALRRNLIKYLKYEINFHQWIKMEILSKSNPKAMALLIQRIIDLTHVLLYNYRNYSAAFSILSALEYSRGIEKLKGWKHVSARFITIYKVIMSEIAPQKNDKFRNIVKQLHQTIYQISADAKKSKSIGLSGSRSEASSSSTIHRIYNKSFSSYIHYSIIPHIHTYLYELKDLEKQYISTIPMNYQQDNESIVNWSSFRVVGPIIDIFRVAQHSTKQFMHAQLASLNVNEENIQYIQSVHELILKRIKSFTLSEEHNNHFSPTISTTTN
ncbi:hypothetical protein SNEBB_003110 [Seison nebaliae]|nr:hypothetical protein SNEBB_003110 [Seison nebaliae]